MLFIRNRSRFIHREAAHLKEALCIAPRFTRLAMDDMLLLVTLATCTATAAAVRLWQWLDEMGNDLSPEDLS